MAIGKKAKDIFQSTVKHPEIGLETAPRVKGRPTATEPYEKVTVCLYKRNVLFLDRVALAVREKTGRSVRRAELVRALIERAAVDLDPEGADFEKAVAGLLE